MHRMKPDLSPRHPKPLYDLLLRLFRSNDDLSNFLSNYEYTRIFDLINSLPSTSVSRTKFTMDAVLQLQAHAIDDRDLFASLKNRFPAQAGSIESAALAYLSVSKDEPDPMEDPALAIPA